MVITRIRILMELFGREASHFENLPKSKYAPLPWKINDELNGGWNGFDKSKFQKSER